MKRTINAVQSGYLYQASHAAALLLEQVRDTWHGRKMPTERRVVRILEELTICLNNIDSSEGYRDECEEDDDE